MDDGAIKFATASKINDDARQRIRKGIGAPSDVLISHKGTVGKVARAPTDAPPFVCSPQTTFWRVLDPSTLNADFLYALMRSPGFQVLFSVRAGETDMAGYVSLTSQRELEIPVPPIFVQQSIAETIGALDDKIELNRQTNETLEALARAIFKDWFVDFGPTRAKAEGRPPYLVPELWDLFPNALDDDDKPEGWTRERIGNHVLAKKGLSYKGAGLTDDANGVPLHNLNSVLEGGGYKNDGLKFYSGDYKPRHIVRPGDLIIANTEQGFDHLLIGYSALIPAWVGKQGLFSHHIFKVEPRPASPLSRVWLHFALSASWFGEAIRRFSNGTTVNMLPPDAFEIPEIIVPPSELVQAFDELVGPMLRRQEDAVGESRSLAETRDLLLPKLMSGELRLREAEQLVEAVA
jgi:type I restriction enzyme S subunit